MIDPKNQRSLISEGREHDETMTKAPWRNGSDPIHFDAPEVTDDKTFAYYVAEPADALGIAWMRTNLRPLLDGYSDALDKVSKLQHELTMAKASSPHALLDAQEQLGRRSQLLDATRNIMAEERATNARLTETARASCENWMSACRQRDDLMKQVTALQSELDHATAHDGDHLSKASRRMVDTVMGDRDALRSEVSAAKSILGASPAETLAQAAERVEVACMDRARERNAAQWEADRMRTVVLAAEAWRDGAALADSTSLDSDLESAIDTYRSKDKP